MEQASLNIGTIGQRLEAARHAKGVSVSEAGQATKILSKYIVSMESDDFGVPSAPVYAKSFIRMYAKYLGVEDQPLVDEYISQHIPKTKTQLTEETRQNLAKTDRAITEAGEPAPSTAAPSNDPGARQVVFADVNESVSGMSGSVAPVKLIVSAVGALVLVGLIVLTVTQCSGDEAKEPTAVGGAASVEHAVITDGVPDAYLARRGVVEVDKN